METQTFDIWYGRAKAGLLRLAGRVILNVENGLLSIENPAGELAPVRVATAYDDSDLERAATLRYVRNAIGAEKGRTTQTLRAQAGRIDELEEQVRTLQEQV
ncbi:MAG TPA: hypothetical protein PLA94_25465, partial [Myxococcota bacterium]|nr:hypothetical protein [Myxococcota bacterium]